MQKPLATPSAKAHERVTGRWNQETSAETQSEWMNYYAKMGLGSPVPYLMCLMAMSFMISRAALEMSSWAAAILVALYIAVDRSSRTREFKFFILGSDITLGFYALLSLLGILILLPFSDYFEGLGALRWIPLAYLFAYGLQLFPGLNRLFALLFVTVFVACGYGLFQHFAGYDLVSGAALPSAPGQDGLYFCIRSFQGSPEVFGTLLAILLPLPIAVFLLADKRDKWTVRWLSLAFICLMSLTIFWTYKPPLWIAAGVGLIISLILHSKRQLILLSSLIGFFLLVLLMTYSSPSKLFEQVKASEVIRATEQRSQINKQYEVFTQNIWFGAGLKGEQGKNVENVGNMYFEILAESGVIGFAFYFVFILTFLLKTYRLWQEIPSTHFWHRVLLSGAMAAQVSFHAAGLYWSTLNDASTAYLFALLLACVAYLRFHYTRGLVPDDYSL